MVRIEFKNGKIYEWANEGIRETKYDGKCFVVVGEDGSIGIYNIDGILAAETSMGTPQNAAAGANAEEGGREKEDAAGDGGEKEDAAGDGGRESSAAGNDAGEVAE